jgi:hypothetical protein
MALSSGGGVECWNRGKGEKSGIVSRKKTVRKGRKHRDDPKNGVRTTDRQIKENHILGGQWGTRITYFPPYTSPIEIHSASS